MSKTQKLIIGCMVVLMSTFAVNASGTNDLSMWRDTFESFESVFEKKINDPQYSENNFSFKPIAEVNIIPKEQLPENFSRKTDEEVRAFLKQPHIQKILKDNFRNLFLSYIQWDGAHNITESFKWVSPVYRIKAKISDEIMGVSISRDYFLSKRVRFGSSQEYQQYIDSTASLNCLFLIQSDYLADLIRERKDVIPISSADLIFQHMFSTAALGKLSPQSSDSLLGDDFWKKNHDLLSETARAKSPTYRYLALQVAQKFETDRTKLLEIYRQAAQEQNQLFWKEALEQLGALKGKDAVATAEVFRLKTNIPSDGTAWPDEANVAEEVEKLISAVGEPEVTVEKPLESPTLIKKQPIKQTAPSEIKKEKVTLTWKVWLAGGVCVLIGWFLMMRRKK